MTEDFSNLIRTVEIFRLSTWEILYPLTDETTQQLLRETPPQDLIVSGDRRHWIRTLEKAIKESEHREEELITRYTTHGNDEFFGNEHRIAISIHFHKLQQFFDLWRSTRHTNHREYRLWTSALSIYLVEHKPTSQDGQ